MNGMNCPGSGLLRHALYSGQGEVSENEGVRREGGKALSRPVRRTLSDKGEIIEVRVRAIRVVRKGKEIEFQGERKGVCEFINECIESGFKHEFTKTRLVRMRNEGETVCFEEQGDLRSLKDSDIEEIEGGKYFYRSNYTATMTDRGKMEEVGLILLGGEDDTDVSSAQFEKVFGRVKQA